MNVRAEVREYPDELDRPYEMLLLRNHWGNNKKVSLQIGDGKEHVFIIEHIRKALAAIEAGA